MSISNLMFPSIVVPKGEFCSKLGTGRLIKVDDPTGTSFFTKCLRKIGLSKPRMILLPNDINIRYDRSETAEMQKWRCHVDGRSYGNNYEYDVRMTKSDEKNNIITQIDQRVRSGSRLEIEFGLAQGSEIPGLRFSEFKENDPQIPKQLIIDGKTVYAFHKEQTLKNGKTVHVLSMDLTNRKPKGAVSIGDKQKYLDIERQIPIPPNAAYATYKGNIVKFYLKRINGETIYERYNKRQEDVADGALEKTRAISQISQEGEKQISISDTPQVRKRGGGYLANDEKNHTLIVANPDDTSENPLTLPPAVQS